MADTFRILVVDDDRAQQFLAEKLLNYFCVNDVVFASGVEEACRIVAETPIDGAIIDLVLENGSGFEVARACAERGIPVVFHTGTEDDHNRNLMYDFGWVLTKPTRAAMIGRAVEYFRTHKKAKGAS